MAMQSQPDAAATAAPVPGGAAYAASLATDRSPPPTVEAGWGNDARFFAGRGFGTPAAPSDLATSRKPARAPEWTDPAAAHRTPPAPAAGRKRHEGIFGVANRHKCAHKGCDFVPDTETERIRVNSLNHHEKSLKMHKSHFAAYSVDCNACQEMIQAGLWNADGTVNTDEKDDFVCAHAGCGWFSTASTTGSRKSSVAAHEAGFRAHRRHFQESHDGRDCPKCQELVATNVWVAGAKGEMEGKEDGVIVEDGDLPFSIIGEFYCRHEGCEWHSTAATAANRKFCVSIHERGFRIHAKHYDTNGRTCTLCQEYLRTGEWRPVEGNEALKDEDGVVLQMQERRPRRKRGKDQLKPDDNPRPSKMARLPGDDWRMPMGMPGFDPRVPLPPWAWGGPRSHVMVPVNPDGTVVGWPANSNGKDGEPMTFLPFNPKRPMMGGFPMYDMYPPPMGGAPGAGAGAAPRDAPPNGEIVYTTQPSGTTARMQTMGYNMSRPTPPIERPASATTSASGSPPQVPLPSPPPSSSSNGAPNAPPRSSMMWPTWAEPGADGAASTTGEARPNGHAFHPAAPRDDAPRDGPAGAPQRTYGTGPPARLPGGRPNGSAGASAGAPQSHASEDWQPHGKRPVMSPMGPMMWPSMGGPMPVAYLSGVLPPQNTPRYM